MKRCGICAACVLSLLVIGCTSSSPGPDAAVYDTGTSDIGTNDVAVYDTGTSDIRTNDVAVYDTGTSDIGTNDVAPVDATDAGGDTADTGAPIDVPSNRPILAYTGTSAMDANDALKPKDFDGPHETSCAKDTTRVYIAELFKHGINDIQVLWHWAPIVPGPDPDHPTLGQPEWSLAGDIGHASDSTDDVLADHPFGMDFDFDVSLDPAYAFLSYPDKDKDRQQSLHCELEMRQFPREKFGYHPKVGDRALLRGVWVLDCGHPPYGAEMHPPTFLAFARSLDAATTTSFAFVLPYRSSLLFNPSVDLATDFGNSARFKAPHTTPLSSGLIAEVVRAVAGLADRLTDSALMIANHFEPVDYLVCAPLPRPVGATLDASWRFTARTGVNVKVTPDDASGCVRVRVSMTDAYTPMALPYKNAEWPWAQLSASASAPVGHKIDVLAEIKKIVKKMGKDPATIPALQADNPPLVDAYAILRPDNGADKDSPTAIHEHADDQPYPFYGHVRAAWK